MNEPSKPLRAPSRHLLAWTTIALVRVAFGALSPKVTGSRLAVVGYGLGHALALGLVAYGAASLWGALASLSARAPRVGGKLRAAEPYLAQLALFGVSYGIASSLLAPDFDNLADRVALAFKSDRAEAIYTALWTIASAVIPILALLGRALGRRYVRLVGFALGLGVAITNELVLANDYRGVHLFLAWGASLLLAPAFPDALVRSRDKAKRPLLIGLVLAGIGALLSVGVWPATPTVLQLLHAQGDVLAPFLARVHGRRLRTGSPATPPAFAPWMKSRADVAAIPAGPPVVANGPIVLLLGVDSARADLLRGARFERRLPELFRMQREAVSFSVARSAGPGTVPAFAAIFSGRYFSQLHWTSSAKLHGIWPASDPTPRFPELLAKHDIPTVQLASALWFVNAYGITKGFTEERDMDPRSNGTTTLDGRDQVDGIIERLKKQGPEPLFIFTHFLDAHAPYDKGGTSGTLYERFVAEVAIVDAELARLHQAVLDLGLAERTITIVTADHGEAFGEHATTQHGTTLYEELLRVPLFIEAPHVAPRRVDEPVSLIDLGPTILDLFGVETPGIYMGQSLAPFLRGESPKLTRPIVAEGRLKRAMFLLDGTKVITDERNGTTEVYDLTTDPREMRNLYVEGAAEQEARVGVIDAFFETHTFRKPGYSVPFRP